MIFAMQQARSLRGPLLVSSCRLLTRACAALARFPPVAQLPGEFTRFDFPPGVPAPFNMLWAIARRAAAASVCAACARLARVAHLPPPPSAPLSHRTAATRRCCRGRRSCRRHRRWCPCCWAARSACAPAVAPGWRPWVARRLLNLTHSFFFICPPLPIRACVSYIDQQDELSVSDWMLAKGLPPRINDEVFIAMAKARGRAAAAAAGRKPRRAPHPESLACG